MEAAVQNKKSPLDNYYVRIIGTLLVIAAAVAVLLALVNMVTKDTIAQHAAEKKAAAMEVVMPGVEDYDVLPIPEFENAKDIKEILLAKTAAGEMLGYCVQTGTNGNDGEIQLMVGITPDGEVTKVSILSQKETMYTNKHGELIEQFAGMADSVALKVDGGEVNAISGATITSRAVTKGVNSALKAVQATMEGGAE